MVASSLTHEDAVKPIMDLVARHDIKYIRLIVIDPNGSPKAMLIPEYQLTDALVNGVAFDGSSILGFAEVNQSDLNLHPDPTTFMVPMWETPGIAVMFCYVSNPDGSYFHGDPRGHLKRTMDELEKEGYGFNTGPELEYFYVTGDNGNIVPFGEGGYFDLPPLDPTEDVKLETLICLEAAGFQLDRVHHEAAQGQQEINFRYSDALKTADNVILYKLAVKTIAQKHDTRATFMPKPFWGINGSGCHMHQSIVELDTGHNIFADEDKEFGLSDIARNYVGGILKHAQAMSMVVAPLVNSYKRLIPHYEAPVYVSWGFANRTALVRIPLAPGEKNKVTRIEYRHPDPSSNPYLVATVLINSGMEGIKKKMEPPEPLSENIYELTKKQMKEKGVEILPEHLGEAVEHFESDKSMKTALGDYLHKNMTELKRAEYEDYMSHTGVEWAASRPKITSWEYERYLTRC
ncbi:MAG: glutamine synthetase family protein [Candidatus Bathyarchaeota archaeon]|nr:glutamine synthetase family protein [Candidatus Bathyarchaeota archaeon]